MSRSRSEGQTTTPIIAIGKQTFAWCNDGSSEGASLQVEHLDQDMEALRNVTNTLGGRRIRWLLDMDRMPTWLQAPPIGTRNLEELRTTALVHALSRLGSTQDPKGAWMVDGQWEAPGPFICRAIGPSLYTLLGNNHWVSSTLELGLGLLPHQTGGQWYCLSTQNEAHLAYLENGKCLHLRSFRVASGRPAKELGQLFLKEWRMEILRANRLGESLQWVHMASCPALDLPNSVTWFSEPLQRHFTKRLGGVQPPEDSEALLKVGLALSAWENVR